MKITKEEFENATSVPDASPLELFWQGIRAEATKRYYTLTLRLILCNILEDVLAGTFEQRVRQFVRLAADDPERILGLLLHISRKLRERSELPHDHPDYMNPCSMQNYFKPIKKLLDMNDVAMKWKRVYTTLPEHDNVSESRGWERHEIGLMLRHAKNQRGRALILVAASSGIRLGGFESLRWSDISPLYWDARRGRLTFGNGGGTESGKGSGDQGGGNGAGAGEVPACAMLTVYGRTSASYPAFITPEAYSALMKYKKVWTRDVGRPPEAGDPIFKRDGGRRPGKVATTTVELNFIRTAQAAGLRDPKNRGHRQYDVPIMNGFRRFWNKTCKESLSGESALASLIKKEYMMGHVGLVSLDRNYFKAHVLELAEEYLHSVLALTIDDAERLQLENASWAGRPGRMLDERDVEIAVLRRTVKEMGMQMEEAGIGPAGAAAEAEAPPPRTRRGGPGAGRAAGAPGPNGPRRHQQRQ